MFYLGTVTCREDPDDFYLDLNANCILIRIRYSAREKIKNSFVLTQKRILRELEKNIVILEISQSSSISLDITEKMYYIPYQKVIFTNKLSPCPLYRCNINLHTNIKQYKSFANVLWTSCSSLNIRYIFSFSCNLFPEHFDRNHGHNSWQTNQVWKKA